MTPPDPIQPLAAPRAPAGVPAAPPAAPQPSLNGAHAAMPPAPTDPEQRLINRDLSWLEFNRRVLAQATDSRTPLLTRVKFLAIFSSNLDEFFMKRVGYIRRQLEAGLAPPTPDGLTPRPLLYAIRSVVNDLIA